MQHCQTGLDWNVAEDALYHIDTYALKLYKLFVQQARRNYF